MRNAIYCLITHVSFSFLLLMTERNGSMIRFSFLLPNENTGILNKVLSDYTTEA